MAIRTILVMCADCDTGYRVVQLARREGLNVIAAVRRFTDPAAFERMGAEIVKLDPTERIEVARAFANLNPDGLGVVSILGGTPTLNSVGNLNVVNVAAEAGVDRFLLVTSIGCGDSAGAVDEFVRAFVGKALTAKTWAERQLQSTKMDWTIIRSGGMLRRNFKGGAILLDSKTVSGHINPTDLGDAVFQALRSDKTIHRILAAVDAEQAVESDGNPVVAADI